MDTEVKKELEQKSTSALVSLNTERVSICDILDRVLSKGAVMAGEVTISVADVELLYLDLRLLLTSIAATAQRGSKPETINRNGS
jgi:gas vesicle structural protein